MALLLFMASARARQIQAWLKIEQRQRRRQELAMRRYLQEERALEQRPDELLLRGLNRIASQWQARTGELLAQGAGIGRADVRLAVRLLLPAQTSHVSSSLEVLWQRWLASNADMPAGAIAALEQLLASVLANAGASPKPIASTSQQLSKDNLDNSAALRQHRAATDHGRILTALPRSTRTNPVVAPAAPRGRA